MSTTGNRAIILLPDYILCLGATQNKIIYIVVLLVDSVGRKSSGGHYFGFILPSTGEHNIFPLSILYVQNVCIHFFLILFFQGTRVSVFCRPDVGGYVFISLSQLRLQVQRF